MSDKAFPCTGCGGCCRLVGVILDNVNNQTNPVFRYAVETFPYKTDSFGVCEKLVDNQCSVYENRPLMCNVSLLGKLLREDTDEWYLKNIKYCNLIIDSLGLDQAYKIPT